MSASNVADSMSASSTMTAKTGVVAVGASAAPTPIYGEFLTSHGFYALSYAEWIQVLGSVYVATLLVKMLVIPAASKAMGIFSK